MRNMAKLRVMPEIAGFFGHKVTKFFRITNSHRISKIRRGGQGK